MVARRLLGCAGDQNDAATGFSPFPGNINQLVMALPAYCAQLARTGDDAGRLMIV